MHQSVPVQYTLSIKFQTILNEVEQNNSLQYLHTFMDKTSMDSVSS